MGEKGESKKKNLQMERVGISFGQKKAICIVQGKTDRISLILGSIKCFPTSFITFLHYMAS
jgi:hypothetical protein